MEEAWSLYNLTAAGTLFNALALFLELDFHEILIICQSNCRFNSKVLLMTTHFLVIYHPYHAYLHHQEKKRKKVLLVLHSIILLTLGWHVKTNS